MKLHGIIARCCASALIALAWTCPAYGAASTEAEERSGLREFFARKFVLSEYEELDAWYTKELQENARLPSGVFRANRLVRSIHFSPESCYVSDGPCPRVYDAAWAAQQKKAKDWLAKAPQSTLAAMVLANAYNQQAWAHRGDGYAHTVRDEDMRTFLELNQKSLRALFTHAEFGRKDPNWWAQLLTFALYSGIDRQSYTKLSQDAIAAFPKNHDVYFAISLGLMPQWGGSRKAIADLAAQAVENTKAEEGQAFYARVYWNLYSWLATDGPAVFTRPDVNWPRIRAGFEDLIQRYPSSVNFNAYARLSCVAAQDKQATAKAIQRMGQDIVPQIWESRAEFARCRSWSQEGAQ
ncbi:hypothetical protein HNP48_006435 [Acidovorax soli]|jgi:hypothetical protein|uniref:DUF4034 domain-containing protein n=1 Tax=Acidovorax soli TaxID=592050 RepID=A0A7X0PKW2_9BURK|nr:hypothetical protein [Acidovorax soli]MBB6563711.1 hypothetical protein [Acidovorax soli]